LDDLVAVDKGDKMIGIKQQEIYAKIIELKLAT